MKWIDKFEVKDLDNHIGIFPWLQIKDTKFYLLLWHFELPLWKNIIGNFVPLIHQK